MAVSQRIYSKEINLPTRHCKRVFFPLNKISLSFKTACWSEPSSLSAVVQLDYSDRFARISDSLCCSLTTKCHQQRTRSRSFSRKLLSKLSNFQKREPVKFSKFYDSKGVTQMLLRSDHFINLNVWLVALGLNLMTSILVLICYHKGI